MTDQPPAPETLLKVIRCMCKGNCSNKTCNCRKHGLICKKYCGLCRGETCTNHEWSWDQVFMALIWIHLSRPKHNKVIWLSFVTFFQNICNNSAVKVEWMNLICIFIPIKTYCYMLYAFLFLIFVFVIGYNNYQLHQRSNW